MLWIGCNPPKVHRTHMYTLIGICLLIAVAMLSGKRQRKGAWLLAAVAIALVIVADRLRWISGKN
jgi:hypothetical protein